MTEYRNARLQASIREVWQALIDPEKTKLWMNGATIESDWKVGGELIIHSVVTGVKCKNIGKVIQFEPECCFKYSFLNGLSDKPTVVKFTLVQNEAETELGLEVEEGQMRFREWERRLADLKTLVEPPTDLNWWAKVSK